MSDVHPVAAAGFGAAADVYERARPSYPREAVEWILGRLALAPNEVVLDVGAGTGKLTRLLADAGARVVAVEPVREMRAKLHEVVPDVAVVDGTGESLPFEDAWASAITVAQAFHWFDVERALPELHRVLRPGGHLVLIWNSRDLDDPLQRSLEDLLASRRGEVAMQEEQAWRPAVERSPLFGPIETRAFRNDQELTLDGLLERVASTSFVAAMPADERAALLAEVASVAQGRDPFRFPYRTDVFLIPRSSDRPPNGRGTSSQG